MPIYSIEITESEAKAIEAHVGDVTKWIQDMVAAKKRKCVDRIFELVDDRRADRIEYADKLSVVDKIIIEPYSEDRQNKDLAQRIT